MITLVAAAPVPVVEVKVIAVTVVPAAIPGPVTAAPVASRFAPLANVPPAVAVLV